MFVLAESVLQFDVIEKATIQRKKAVMKREAYIEVTTAATPKGIPFSTLDIFNFNIPQAVLG